jgi:hypothetical protein
MPFHPTDETLAFWRAADPEPVTDDDIALMERHLGLSAPAAYAEFLKTYGAVEFDDDIPCAFDVVYPLPDGEERRTAAIAFFKDPKTALRYHDGLQQDPDVDIPPHLLPFAMDDGQSELLIEFGRPTQRIFFWDFDAHDWDSGETRLGFVADDLYQFIANLKLLED